MKYFSLLKEKQFPIVNFRLPPNQLRESTFIICYLSTQHELKILITTSPRPCLQSRRARLPAIQAVPQGPLSQGIWSSRKSHSESPRQWQALWGHSLRVAGEQWRISPGETISSRAWAEPRPWEAHRLLQRRIAKGNREPLRPSHLGADGQGHVPWPNHEVWKEGPREGSLREGENVGAISHVVEGDVPFLVIQEHPYPKPGVGSLHEG